MRLVAMTYIATFGNLDSDKGWQNPALLCLCDFTFYYLPSRETKASICPKQIFQMTRGSQKMTMSQMIGMLRK